MRYDGGHRRDAWLVDDLGRRAELVPVCPEVEVGLGVPRPPIHLEQRGGRVALVRIHDAADLTARFDAWIETRLDALAALDLDAYVFKAKSPSCGVGDVPVHDVQGRIVAVNDGAFARALRRRWPRLPVVDERALETAAGRAAFETAMIAYARHREADA